MALSKLEKKLSDVTPKQKQVLQRVLRGESNAEIAQKLKLSSFTVANHMRRLFIAFGVDSRARLLSLFVVIPEGLQLKAGRPKSA
jgi:DNA-binding CsgD family transcriptional regulator